MLWQLDDQDLHPKHNHSRQTACLPHIPPFTWKPDPTTHSLVLRALTLQVVHAKACRLSQDACPKNPMHDDAIVFQNGYECFQACLLLTCTWPSSAVPTTDRSTFSPRGVAASLGKGGCSASSTLSACPLPYLGGALHAFNPASMPVEHMYQLKVCRVSFSIEHLPMRHTDTACGRPRHLPFQSEAQARTRQCKPEQYKKIFLMGKQDCSQIWQACLAGELTTA